MEPEEEINKITEAEGSIPEAIFLRKTLKFILAVDDTVAAKVANTAAQASPLGVDREIIWIKKPNWEALSTQVAGLPLSCLAFSLSPTNLLKDTIVNEKLRFTRIDRAFLRAGITESFEI